jgi:hypothetical protein
MRIKIAIFLASCILYLSCMSANKTTIADDPQSYYAPVVDSILHHSNFDFETVKTNGFELYYVQNDYFKDTINYLLKDVLAAYRHCEGIIGKVQNLPAIKVVYFDEREKMKPFVGFTPKGIALPDAHTLLIATNPTIRAYHKHELMHILSWHKFNGYAATPSDWIQEGLSVYADSPCLAHELHEISAYLIYTNKYVKLNELAHKFRTFPDMVAYMQAGSVAQFLIEKYGIQKFERIWKQGFDKIPQILGVSQTQVEDEYIKTILRKYPKKPELNWEYLDKNGCG